MSFGRFPFDPKSPIGYLLTGFIEYVILSYEYYMNASTLGLAIGAFWFAISATKETQRILHSIKEKVLENELKILFPEFIQFHGMVKQLSLFPFCYFHQLYHCLSFLCDKFVWQLIFFRVGQHFSDVFQPIFMSIFTWSLVAISCVMLIIQVEVVEYI